MGQLNIEELNCRIVDKELKINATPEARLECMKSIKAYYSGRDDTMLYLFTARQIGYRDVEHCKEELYEQDKEVCFYFFPEMRKRDESKQTGIFTDNNVFVSGGDYSGSKITS